MFQFTYRTSIQRGELQFHAPQTTRVGQPIRVNLHLPDGTERSVQTSITRVTRVPGANQVSVRIADATANELYKEMLAAERAG